jgi:hypothetical protein
MGQIRESHPIANTNKITLLYQLPLGVRATPRPASFIK